MRILRSKPFAARALPGLSLETADAEIEHALQSGDRYVMIHYLRIVRALSKKAAEGDKGAAEILLKHVVSPTREQVERVQSERPSGPPPLVIRVANARIQANILNKKDKPVVQLTQDEFSALPEPKRTELSSDYKLDFVEAAMLTTAGISPAGEGTISPSASSLSGGMAPSLSLHKKPNRTCSKCGAVFHARLKTSHVCQECRKRADIARLTAHKRERGEYLSPALRKVVSEVK